MALQDYAVLKVFLDGQELKQVTSVRKITRSGIQAVNLLTEGLGGFTSGAGSIGVEIGFAVPRGGTEYPYQQKCANEEFVTIQFVSGADVYVGTGKLEEVEIGQSTNANTEGSANFMGELRPFDSF